MASIAGFFASIAGSTLFSSTVGATDDGPIELEVGATIPDGSNITLTTIDKSDDEVSSTIDLKNGEHTYEVDGLDHSDEPEYYWRAEYETEGDKTPSLERVELITPDDSGLFSILDFDFDFSFDFDFWPFNEAEGEVPLLSGFRRGTSGDGDSDTVRFRQRGHVESSAKESGVWSESEFEEATKRGVELSGGRLSLIELEQGRPTGKTEVSSPEEALSLDIEEQEQGDASNLHFEFSGTDSTVDSHPDLDSDIAGIATYDGDPVSDAKFYVVNTTEDTYEETAYSNSDGEFYIDVSDSDAEYAVFGEVEIDGETQTSMAQASVLI
ncbi:hypothetical protein [Natronorubrum daqingense]|nr:hypothetical protein [Natronorubrum daqingense]SIS08219.1 hypothetical protein SAMN05421809_3773 [Natronorubrum daqingense]